MKIGIVLGILFGLLVGGLAVFIVIRTRSSPAAVPSTRTPSSKSSDPLVGVWRTRIDAITATYDFHDDRTFTLTFKGVPLQPTGPGNTHEAAGTWRVDSGKTLFMKNITSATPLTIVGEEESATILSNTADKLVLLNIDRKGRKEQISFARVPEFIVGQCDNPKIIGTWQADNGDVLELYEDGQLMWQPSREMYRKGQWSQQQKTFRLLLQPPGDGHSDVLRRARPELADPQDVTYDIVDFSSDGNTMRLRLSEIERAAPVTYRRTNVRLRHPQQNQPRRTGVPRY